MNDLILYLQKSYYYYHKRWSYKLNDDSSEFSKTSFKRTSSTCILSRLITNVHMCKSLQTHRHTQICKGPFQTTSSWSTKHWRYHTGPYKHEHWNRMERLLWHSPCVASYCMSLVLKSHPLRHFSTLTPHTLPLQAESSAAPFPSRFSFTHATATCCKELPTATLTISKSNWVREIHFGFFLFFPRWSARQLLWWWDTKTALAANAHMSGKIIEFVFASVCVRV